jgi:hypothetical protein
VPHSGGVPAHVTAGSSGVQQSPSSVQICVSGQSTQASPPMPQVASVLVRQIPCASQQPFGQLVAVHVTLGMQSPLPLQVEPGGQSTKQTPVDSLHDSQASPSQSPSARHSTQTPEAGLHIGAAVVQAEMQIPRFGPTVPQMKHGSVVQLSQAAPPTPQLVFELVRQRPCASQQPCGQLVALQTQTPCALQSCPLGQSTQATPLMPQVVSELVRQTPCASQHPFGQVVALQIGRHRPAAVQVVVPVGQQTGAPLASRQQIESTQFGPESPKTGV